MAVLRTTNPKHLLQEQWRSPDFIGPLVPFLWFVLACVAFLRAVSSLQEQMIESGSLNKVKFGVIEQSNSLA